MDVNLLSAALDALNISSDAAAGRTPTLEKPDNSEGVQGVLTPSQVAQTALTVQIERMRLSEALLARDTVVQYLSTACKSIEEKTATIENLQREKRELQEKLADWENHDGGSTLEGLKVKMEELKATIKTLQEELRVANEKLNTDRSSNYDDVEQAFSGQNLFLPMAPLSRQKTPDRSTQLARQEALRALREATWSNPSRLPSPGGVSRGPASPSTGVYDRSADISVAGASSDIEPEESIKARHAILGSLPIPSEIPSDVLKPIILPPSLTIHELLSNASGLLKSSLSNYRVLQELTTHWCPEREEHGYFLAPLFKCNTNPRVATAHRWAMGDVIGKMIKPTECFYNKDGKWYYAGVYKAIRLDDLTTNEWEQLSTETTQTLIKETLAGRKNVSPQNIYETTQLYAAGALKVACVGLQCIGFNNTLYHAVLEQAAKSTMQSGRYRTPFGAGSNANANINPNPTLNWKPGAMALTAPATSSFFALSGPGGSPMDPGQGLGK